MKKTIDLFMCKIKKKLDEEIYLWLLCLDFPGLLGRKLRSFIVKIITNSSGSLSVGKDLIVSDPKQIFLGNNVSVGNRCALQAVGDGIIKIGNNVSINNNVSIGASENGEIIIGNDVLIAQNVVIRANNHRYDNIKLPIYSQGHTKGKIEIKEDVWIGANSVILPNVKIGPHSIIAAGSVVTNDVKEYDVVGGVPARVLKSRLSINSKE